MAKIIQKVWTIYVCPYCLHSITGNYDVDERRDSCSKRIHKGTAKPVKVAERDPLMFALEIISGRTTDKKTRQELGALYGRLDTQ